VNAVNLISMMLAAEAAVSSKPQQNAGLPATTDFWWQLQQLVQANGKASPLVTVVRSGAQCG
jgi:hypothetical protein